MTAQQIRNIASRIEEIAIEMEELLDEAETLVNEVDTIGEDIGADVGREFKHYIKPNMLVLLRSKDTSGFLTNDRGLGDVALAALLVADEVENMIDDEE